MKTDRTVVWIKRLFFIFQWDESFVIDRSENNVFQATNVNPYRVLSLNATNGNPRYYWQM